MARVSFHPICDQHILQPVKIHIHENGTPTPVRCRDACVMGDLGKHTEPPVEEQGIAHPLRPVVVPPRHGAILHARNHLVFSRAMAGVQHVDHEKIIEPVAIDVRKIDPHGEHAGFPQCQRRRLAKPALPHIEPEPVEAVEIIANINVRLTVTVDIPKHHRQAPLEQRAGHRCPFCGHKPRTAHDIPFKSKLAKVAIKHIRKAVFLDATAFVDLETVLEFRSLDRHPVDAGDRPAAPNGSKVEVSVRHVHQRRVSIISDI